MSEGSQESLLRDWEMLLMSARGHEAELAGIVSLREALETAYSRARATRYLRETLQLSSRKRASGCGKRSPPGAELPAICAVSSRAGGGSASIW